MTPSNVILNGKLKHASSLMMSHVSEHGAIDYSSGTYLKPQSSKDIKKKVKEARLICIGCQRIESKEDPFKACKNCQARFYCSRECQKKDWPEHKKSCSDSQRQKRLTKLATAFIANINLMGYLKVAIALKLGLLNYSVNDPFSVLVPMMIELENITDFAGLRGDLGPNDDTKSPEKVKGMLQIAGILPCGDDYHLPEEKLLALWKTKRAEADATGPTYAAGIVGVIVFALTDSTPTTAAILEVPIVIPSNFLGIAAAAQPFGQILTAPPITVRKVPMTADSCMELVNSSFLATSLVLKLALNLSQIY
ncbi:hypothetical protein BDN70DRAFT_708207 [Pholiota conissans]|uniref:MYND-type domain-containing protein n=1 Tax=Pholiota conissans TaxID=109636 RepID=A0A9P6D609_9AGAR|nr:hypothetical protein BDN70DRAFT_708207 [Pholiota conissans]